MRKAITHLPWPRMLELWEGWTYILQAVLSKRSDIAIGIKSEQTKRIRFQDVSNRELVYWGHPKEREKAYAKILSGRLGIEVFEDCRRAIQK